MKCMFLSVHDDQPAVSFVGIDQHEGEHNQSTAHRIVGKMVVAGLPWRCCSPSMNSTALGLRAHHMQSRGAFNPKP